MSKKTGPNIQRINQALSAAVSSINLAKNLLKDIESQQENKLDTRELPGVIGTFTGFVVSVEGAEDVEVPQNYSSKSKIVYGDTLKVIEDNGKQIFKQIDRVKRINKTGIVSKNNGKLMVVTSDGAYEVLPVAAEFYQFEEGDEVEIILPQENLQAPFAAIEKNHSKGDKQSVNVKDEKKVKPVVESVKKPVEKVVEKPAEKKKVVDTPKSVVQPRVSRPQHNKPFRPEQSKKPTSPKVEPKKQASSQIASFTEEKDEKTISRLVGDDDLR